MRRASRGAGSRAPALALLTMLWITHSVGASGVFELQILEFSNPRVQLSSGRCCGGAGAGGAGGRCLAPCRTRFSLCLKEYQSAAAPGACSFGRAASPTLGTDSFTLVEPLYTLALNFTFRWTRSFTLILQAHDDYNYTAPETGLIGEAWWSGIVEPGAAWHALRGEAARGSASVAYRVRVLCQPNYYNSTCTTFCRPRDDNFGHYFCSPQGDKRCLPGWRGDNCDIPVCKEGCHPTHGRCDAPGECACRPGWRGELCDHCTPYPGCKHGYCNGSSWDCTCDTNWGGILCDQDLNYCGTHEPCQHGGTCENTAPDQYLCRCADGFSGSECERVDNPCAPQPCARGACALAPDPPGFLCTCQPGWTGPLCDQDIDECASSPCQHGATCHDRVDGFHCECAPGWTGLTCTEDLDECAASEEGVSAAEGVEGAEGLGPCVNAATCSNTLGGFSCACLPGWSGPRCEANVDDCVGQCLNGATCIDLVDDYHCACAPGYAGRTCALDVDECASAPCRHGGECVDLIDAYRCICPVGFSGTDCEDDRDHCAGSPCANGAACYTAQSDYYCHCAPGWSGKNCSLPAPAAAACGAGCGRGRCLRAAQPARCVCEPGYKGPTCTEHVECSEAGGGAECGVAGACVAGRCVCKPGWTGAHCDIEIDECASNPCHNNSTCIDGVADFSCLCTEGWSGKTCNLRSVETSWCGEAGSCLNGGSCVSGACVCRTGWGGARCERGAAPAGSAGSAECGAGCRHGGRCVRGSCECPPAWRGADCSRPVPACAACPRAATCLPDPDTNDLRCVCPPPDHRDSKRCLELVAGLGDAEDEVEEEYESSARNGAVTASGGVCSSENGTWWWGCNACWCAHGTAACTRLWCGVADCLPPAAAACRADEVCVPAAPALCMKAPCAAPGECRRVAGRRVEPPPLPAPSNCWPGRPAPSPAPPNCARALLELARERIAPGAHVERACSSLRRALAVAIAPRATPIVLLCDLATDDQDALDLALWVSPEEGSEGTSTLAAAVRALSELVSRRRLALHPLLGAALSLRVAAGSAAARDQPPPGTPLAVVLAAALLPAAAAAAAVALWLHRRRRRRADERCRHDEEKSNNLQNEENLRRYANPLREEAGEAAVADELPRALYKAQNADARNNTPPRLADKEFTKRALPPHAPCAPPALARAPPPERLTVLV